MARFLVVLGGGGHTAEMIELTRHLGPHDYEYVVARDDGLSAGKIIHPGPVYRLTNLRGMNERALSAALFRSIPALFSALAVIRRAEARVIVTSGPALCVPVCLIGKLFRRKLVFVETISRVRTISRTAGILYRVADLFFAQWEEAIASHPRARYCGRLM